jgi:hypothetical protein
MQKPALRGLLSSFNNQLTISLKAGLHDAELKWPQIGRNQPAASDFGSEAP